MTPVPAAGWAFLAWPTLHVILAAVYHVRDVRQRLRRVAASVPAAAACETAGDGVGSRWDRDGRRALGTIILAGAASFSAYGWGRAALRLIGPLGFTATITELLSLIAGWGILSHGLLVLGLTRRLRRAWVVPLGLAGIALGAAAVLSRLRSPGLWSPSHGLSQAGAVAAGFCLAILVIVAISCFAPSRGFDAQAYHLELPRRYAASGRIPYVPFMAHSAWPQAVHMLFVPGFLFRCAHYAQVTSYLMGVAVLGLVFEVVRIGAGLDGAIVAAVVLLTVGEFMFQMGEASVDVGLATFTFAALVCFGTWLESPEPGLLALAGVFAGFAASTKLSSLLLIVVLAAGAFLSDLVSRGVWASILSASSLILMSGIVAAPWYVRSAWLTGNPVFHFATRVFKTRNWARSSELAHRAVGDADGWGPIRGLRGWISYARGQLLRSPTGWGLGIVSLVPLAPLLPADPLVQKIGATSLALTLVTLANTTQVRLMIGPAAGLAALGGAAFVYGRGLTPATWYPSLLAAGLGALGLFAALDANRHKLRAALDRKRTPAFLRRFLPYYDDFIWINANTPKDARILLWTTRGYLLERDYVWLPPWQQGILDFTSIRDAPDFWRELKKHGVTHVYYTDYEIRRSLFAYLYDLHEEMVRRGMLLEERVFGSRYTLYRVA